MNLPYPAPPFEGTIGKTYKESKPAWPKIPTAAKDAPNVVIILLDDVGFGQTSTFGGLIPTRCSPGAIITTAATGSSWSGRPGFRTIRR
jgi:hypothetical protein